MTFQQFLWFCQGEGLNAVIGIILSFLAEWWPQFQASARREKMFVMLGLNIIIPLLAALISYGMGYQDGGFATTFWPALSAGGMAFLASQATYLTKVPQVVRRLRE